MPNQTKRSAKHSQTERSAKHKPRGADAKARAKAVYIQYHVHVYLPDGTKVEVALSPSSQVRDLKKSLEEKGYSEAQHSVFAAGFEDELRDSTRVLDNTSFFLLKSANPKTARDLKDTDVKNRNAGVVMSKRQAASSSDTKHGAAQQRVETRVALRQPPVSAPHYRSGARFAANYKRRL
jgi:hypothetical protein